MADEQVKPTEKKAGFLQEKDGSNSSRRLTLVMYSVPILGVYIYQNIALKAHTDFMWGEVSILGIILASIIGPETITAATAMLNSLSQIIKPKG